MIPIFKCYDTRKTWFAELFSQKIRKQKFNKALLEKFQISFYIDSHKKKTLNLQNIYTTSEE